MSLVRVCITGPECTGKSTLTQDLAKHYHTTCVPEASRQYAERVSRPLTVDDVEPIAREHISLVDASIVRARRVIFLDADLTSTVVYAQFYYGFTSTWLEREEQSQRAELYLLCDVDVPWVADGIRDQPENRGAMRERFARELERIEARVVPISGDWPHRLEEAVRAVDALLAG